MLLDANDNSKRVQLDGSELSCRQFEDGRDGLLQGLHQPVGGCVEQQSDLSADGAVTKVWSEARWPLTGGLRRSIQVVIWARNRPCRAFSTH